MRLLVARGESASGHRERPVDQVDSYFGMLNIGVAPGADGRNRITLNGKVRFLPPKVEQEYWPGGIYTAPTEEALTFDLEYHKGAWSQHGAQSRQGGTGLLVLPCRPAGPPRLARHAVYENR